MRTPTGSRRPVQELPEARRRVRPETQLLQHADARPLAHARADDLLYVQILGRQRIEIVALPALARHGELALPRAVGPLGVEIADPLHLEAEERLELHRV